MTDVIQNPHLATWDASLSDSARLARALTAGLTPARQAHRPSWGGWSVGEVFEHLCVTDGLYVAPLRALFAAERSRTTPRLGNAWRPTLWGRMLLWSVNPSNTRRAPAPKVFLPGPAPRAHVIDAWLAQVETNRALLREAEGLDLRQLKLSSPAARLIRLNAGDAFAIMTVHAQRHLGQVQRTLDDARQPTVRG